MAWSAPKTFAYKETLSSSDMNTYVSDDLTYLYDLISNNDSYCAMAYSAVAQTNLTDNLYTKVVLGTEDYDPNSNFATSTYTVPATGKYTALGQVYFKNCVANKRYVAAIYVDGTVYITNHGNNGGYAGYFSVPVSDILDLTAGQTVELYARSNSGDNTVDIEIGRNTFLAVKKWLGV